MRSRTIREGSVGLLILAGLGLFIGLVMWLRGLNLGNRSYSVIVEFGDVGGMQVGAPVRYRGVNVGRITAISPGPAGVAVELEISSAELIIPANSLIEANQSGLIGETSIDITPQVNILPSQIATQPLATDCQPAVIICDGDRLVGQVGVSFDELISATVKLTDLFTDPELFNNLKSLTRNTSEAAAGVSVLTRQVTSLARSVESELSTLSDSATVTTRSVGQAADQISLTAAQVNDLLTSNRSTLVGTLNNLNATSTRLQTVINRLSPAIEEGDLVQNLTTLSANAAEASENLRNLTQAVGSDNNILLLQQTLDSARATFQNAQKITADLDELTGDPAFRSNLRELVNGLSGLVSSTQELRHQAEVARTLAPAATVLQSTELPPQTPMTIRLPAQTASRTTPLTPNLPTTLPTGPLPLPLE